MEYVKSEQCVEREECAHSEELRVCGELPNLNKNQSFENFSKMIYFFRCAIASFNSCENCKNLIKIGIGIDFVKLMKLRHGWTQLI